MQAISRTNSFRKWSSTDVDSHSTDEIATYTRRTIDIADFRKRTSTKKTIITAP